MHTPSPPLGMIQTLNEVIVCHGEVMESMSKRMMKDEVRSWSDLKKYVEQRKSAVL
jgi:hypothetical protein